MAALVIDAVDQTIFQSATDIDLDAFNYQGYDKALDIHYLTIAYIATFRNWASAVAVAVAAGLWYYRLVGVTLFELTQWRPLLLIFPNTFEYFFIFLSVVGLKWNGNRLSARHITLAAAAIWVFVKLPQEYWIHIAQLDTTDVVKQDLFGVDASDSWRAAVTNRPLVLVVAVLVVVAVAAVVARLWRRLPPADHPLRFDADRLHPAPVSDSADVRRWHDGLAEKVVLLTLVTIIFTKALPRSTATTVQIVFGVAWVVAGNAVVTQFIRRRGVSWSTTGRAFMAAVAINAGVLLALRLVSPADNEQTVWSAALFLLLLSLIITIFDRYHPGRATLRPAGR